MATYTIETPAKPNFKTTPNLERWMSKQSIQNLLNGIGNFSDSKKLWGDVVKSTKVDPAILISWACTVSGFNHGFNDGTRMGIMGLQLEYGTPNVETKKRQNLKEVLNYERRQGRMTANELAFFKKFNFVYDEKTRSFPDVTQQLLGTFDFNLYLGAIFLGQLIDGKVSGITMENWNVDNKLNLKLERCLALYYYTCNTNVLSVKLSSIRRHETALELLNAIEPTEPALAGCIKNLLGVNGYLANFKESLTISVWRRDWLGYY